MLSQLFPLSVFVRICIVCSAIAFLSLTNRGQVTNIDEFCDQFQTDRSKFCISIKAVNGRFAVDATRLRLNNTLRNNYRPQLTDTNNISSLNSFLSQKVNALLSLDGNATCNLLTPSDPKFCRQDGPWTQIKANFVRPVLFQSKMTNIFREKINQDSPLILIRRDIEPVNPVIGMIEFEIDDPIDNVCDESKYAIEFRPDESTAISDRSGICDLLGGLNNKFWDKKLITELVTNFYAKKGLLPALNFIDIDEKKVLTIQESPVLDRVFLRVDWEPTDKRDRPEMMKIFYNVLPHAEWKSFAAAIKGSKTTPDEHPLERDDLGQRFYRFPNKEYFNLFEYQTQQLRLAGIGYDLSFSECNVDDTEVHRVCLEVTRLKKDDIETKTVDEEERAVPVANGEGVVDTNIVKPEEQNKPVPKSNLLKKRKRVSADESSDDDTATKSEDANGNLYFGGGFKYQVGEKPRFFARVQRRLYSGSDASLQIGGEKEVFGSASYFKDYIFFEKLERRLSFQLTAKSDFNGSRRFAGLKTDERRSGGLIRAELDLLNNWRHSLVRVYIEAQRTTVQLARDETIIAKSPLSTLDIGAGYYFQGDPVKKYPHSGRVEARMRFGLGLAAEESTFTAFSTKGKYHRQTVGGIELDIAGRIEFRSSSTPVYELASFGGAESIRGFRPDELLGRRKWTIQPEIWFPIPDLWKMSKNPLAEMLRENIRLAGFVDVGGIYKTQNRFSGVKAGPGADIRFVKNPVVLKFDWAYGIGKVPTPLTRGNFYFGVETNLPF